MDAILALTDAAARMVEGRNDEDGGRGVVRLVLPDASDEGAGSGRGKGRRDRTGWGSLPPAILHRIMSHLVMQTELHPTIVKYWQPYQPSCVILRRATARKQLCVLRKVCHGWARAVNSHSFWTTFIHSINPRFEPPSTGSVQGSGTAASAQANSTAMMNAAKRHYLSTCLVCQIYTPNRYPIRHATVLDHTSLRDVGLVALCSDHLEAVCQGCLRTQQHPTCATYDINLQEIDTFIDWDEDGGIRPRGSLTCERCRFSALKPALMQELEKCRYGGPLRGSVDLFDADTADYLCDSDGTVHSAAHDAMERHFMFDQMRSSDIEFTILLLQKNEAHWRDRFSKRELEHLHPDELAFGPSEEVIQPRGPTDEAEARLLRSRVITYAQLPWMTMTERDVYNEMVRGKRQWWWEYATKGKTAFTVETRLIFQAQDLTSKYAGILRSYCIRDFIDRRLLVGFWVKPSDEVRLLASLPVSIPSESLPPTVPALRDVLVSSTYPLSAHPDWQSVFDEYQRPTLELAPDSYNPGLIHLWATPSNFLEADSFLPPPVLLKDMDEAFADGLHGMLYVPLRHLADQVRSMVNGDADAAEAICAGMGSGEVLEALRGQAVWIKPVRARRLKRPERGNGRGSAGHPTSEPISKGSNTNTADQSVHRDEGAPAAQSPRVELVIDEETMAVDPTYGIEIVKTDDERSSPIISPITGVHETRPRTNRDGAHGDTELKVVIRSNSNSTLGKRKDPPLSKEEEGSPPTSRPTPTRRASGSRTIMTDDGAPVRHQEAMSGHVGESGAVASKSASRETTVSTAEDEIVMPITPRTEGEETLPHDHVPVGGIAGDIKPPADAAVARDQHINPAPRISQTDSATSQQPQIPAGNGAAHKSSSATASSSDGEDESDVDDDDSTVEVGRGPRGHYEPQDGDDAFDVDGDEQCDPLLDDSDEELDEAKERRGRNVTHESEEEELQPVGPGEDTVIFKHPDGTVEILDWFDYVKKPGHVAAQPMKDQSGAEDVDEYPIELGRGGSGGTADGAAQHQHHSLAMSRSGPHRSQSPADSVQSRQSGASESSELTTPSVSDRSSVSGASQSSRREGRGFPSERDLHTPLLRIPYVPSLTRQPPTAAHQRSHSRNRISDKDQHGPSAEVDSARAEAEAKVKDDEDMGPAEAVDVIASELIMRVWYDARAHLRLCRCKICSRSRTREELRGQPGGTWG